MSSKWRERMEAIGKQNFILEEMIRLGFLSQQDVDSMGPVAERHRQLLDQLSETSATLDEVIKKIAASKDVEAMIAEVRRERIARVKAAREEKRRQKAILAIERAEQNEIRKRDFPTFFGRGYSGAVDFNESITPKSTLPELKSFKDIADNLSLTTSQLQWLIYHRQVSTSDHYSRFEIPKRSGKMRVISSPKPAMKKAQAWIRESILSKMTYHDAAMAFRPEKSIVDNAKIHAGARVIIRIDLKDFFPSIGFDRVLRFFELAGNFNGGVSTVLALICTDAPRAKVVLDGQVQWAAIGPRSLPQGALTSPDLANLIAYGLDVRLSAYAEKSGWKYTRYADDLVISTSSEEANAKGMVTGITAICEAEGFKVNPDKTRVMRSPNRQTVTGIVVNDGNLRLSRRDMRRIRAFMHQCEAKGLDQVSIDKGKNALSIAKGYFAYVFMVNQEAALSLVKKHPWVS
jgi:RNA-directed DNA polymerase